MTVLLAEMMLGPTYCHITSPNYFPGWVTWTCQVLRFVFHQVSSCNWLWCYGYFIVWWFVCRV